MTKQQQSSNLALIYVKMASVMGVTWVFGIGVGLQALSFLWYPYVVLNNLPGKCPSAYQSWFGPEKDWNVFFTGITRNKFSDAVADLNLEKTL